MGKTIGFCLDVIGMVFLGYPESTWGVAGTIDPMRPVPIVVVVVVVCWWTRWLVASLLTE